MSGSEGVGSPREFIRDHGIAILCLAVCTLVYLWPLVSRLTSAIPDRPGNTDVTESVWAVGWVRHALTHTASLASTDQLFVPFGADLRLHSLGLLQALMAFPWTGLLGVVGAYNLILVLTFFLNGLLAYGFVHALVKNPQAALLASACLMLSGALVWHFGAGRLALPALWIVIAVVWCTKRLLDAPDWKRGGWLGLALAAAAFSDLQILLFSVLWAGMFLTFETFRNPRRVFSNSTLQALAVAGASAGIPFFLYYGPVLFSSSTRGYLVPNLTDLSFYSLQLDDLWNAEMIPHIYGFDFLVLVIGAFILYGRRGAHAAWTFASLIFLALTLGPVLKPFEIPLPYAALSLWPAAMQFRTPYRFVLPALIGWAVAAGYLLAGLLPRARGRTMAWVLVLALVGLRLWYTIELSPFETQTYPAYDFYRRLAAEPGDFVILEAPFGIRSGLDRIGADAEALQYYQHIHGKRIVNGSLSRLPARVFEVYRSHPSLMFLAGEAGGEPDALSADFSEVLTWTGAKYVLLHRSLLTEGQADRMEAFLRDQPQLEHLLDEQDLVVFHVR